MTFMAAIALLRTLDKKTWTFLAIAILGLFSLGIGGYFTYDTHFRHPQYSYLPVDEEWKQHLRDVVAVAQAAEASPGSVGPKKVVVDVSGAVEKPGVYELSTPARVQDAVLMAGGFLEDSDKRFIHQELNLASQVQDQQKLYIPFTGEEQATAGSSTSPVLAQAVTVNTATEKQLQEIDGIGEKRSEAILAGRPYTSSDDFFSRSGLSQSLAELVLQELPSFE